MKEIQFCKNQKALRVSKNLGQKQLAELVLTTVKTISHWETGYSEPSIEQLCALAKLFDVTLDDLVWGGG